MLVLLEKSLEFPREPEVAYRRRLHINDSVNLVSPYTPEVESEERVRVRPISQAYSQNKIRVCTLYKTDDVSHDSACGSLVGVTAHVCRPLGLGVTYETYRNGNYQDETSNAHPILVLSNIVSRTKSAVKHERLNSAQPEPRLDPLFWPVNLISR